MSGKPNKIGDLPYNTLTVYFAPLFFPDMQLDFANAEMRLVLKKDFFDGEYLNKDIDIRQALAGFYLLSETGNFYNNQYILHSYLGDISLSEGEIIVYKLNTFRMDLPVSLLADMQNILHLRSSALSRGTKKRIQKFWQEANRVQVLFKVTDELYPTDYVKHKFSQRLGVDINILKQMTDLTEAITYENDSLEGVLERLNIKVNTQ